MELIELSYEVIGTQRQVMMAVGVLECLIVLNLSMRAKWYGYYSCECANSCLGTCECVRMCWHHFTALCIMDSYLAIIRFIGGM